MKDQDRKKGEKMVCTRTRTSCHCRVYGMTTRGRTDGRTVGRTVGRTLAAKQEVLTAE